MEQIILGLNEPERFDELVNDGLKEGNDLVIVSKANATTGGMSAIVISFTAQLPDSTIVRVQAVTTLKLLQEATTALTLYHSAIGNN